MYLATSPVITQTVLTIRVRQHTGILLQNTLNPTSQFIPPHHANKTTNKTNQP